MPNIKTFEQVVNTQPLQIPKSLWVKLEGVKTAISFLPEDFNDLAFEISSGRLRRTEYTIQGLPVYEREDNYR